MVRAERAARFSAQFTRKLLAAVNTLHSNGFIVHVTQTSGTFFFFHLVYFLWRSKKKNHAACDVVQKKNLAGLAETKFFYHTS